MLPLNVLLHAESMLGGQHAWSFSKMLIKSRHIVPGLANWLEMGFPDVN